MSRVTHVSVSKRGTIQLLVLIDNVWRGIPLEEDEAMWLSAELKNAWEKVRSHE